MSAPQLNLAIESIHNRTNMSALSRPHRLEPIIEDDEGDSSDVPVRRQAVQPALRSHARPCRLHGPRTKRVVWFCCQCQSGPNAFNYVLQCLECYHDRCTDCQIETSKA
ncbi:hypothetical protein DL98DRAFT_510866 [Cadophora sp. DSE1049]|nr:hypothetical protein DL98DRAFT_510866 [Cadophora sp. DSE1049]